MALKFEVLHSEWVADGESFPANDNPYEIEDASDDLVRLATAAHHAGALNVTEGLADGVVQSQEDGEAALQEAMGEYVPAKPTADGTMEPGYWTGPWYEGHMAQAEADTSGKATAAAGIDVEPGEEAEG